MIILREFKDIDIKITLTEDELYKAHRQYLSKAYCTDVINFIEKHLNITEEVLRDAYNIVDEDIIDMAESFYQEQLEEQTKIYAMAKSVIPYLEERGVVFEGCLSDFQSCEDDMNC